MTESRDRRVIAAWLAICIALAVAGQYMLARQQPKFGYGVALYALSVGGFILLTAWLHSDVKVSAPKLTWQQPVRGVLVIVSLGLLGWAMVLIMRNPPTYELPLVLWMLSIIAFVLAFVRGLSSPAWRTWLDKAREHRYEIMGVAAIVILGGLLRGVNLAHVPMNIGGDEGSQGLEAIDFLTGAKTDMFVTGWLGVPTMSFFFQSLWYRLFGVSVVTLRLPWAFVGTVTLIVFYLLVRRLLGTRLALIGTFFLATYNYHIHFSRLGSNQVADPLFMALTLYFLTRGLSNRKALDFAIAGVAMGASIYFYAGARLTFVFVAAYILLLALFDSKQLRGNWGNLGVLAVAAVIVVLPIGWFYSQHPDDFNARLNQVGILQSGWLTREVQITGRPAWRLLLDQFQRAFFAFTYYHDRTVWYGATIPLMQFASSIFFMLGLGLATVRFRKKEYLPFVVWFWLALILGGMLTESPPSSQRLVTLVVPASVFVAVAVQEVADIVGGLRERSLAWRNGFAASTLVVLAVLGTTYYFVKFTPTRLYGSLNGEVATEVGYYLKDLGPDYRCFFFGPPRMYYGFATIPYLAQDTEGMDILDPISAEPDFVPPDKGAVFIFLPERLWEFQFVKAKYPGGTMRDFVHANSHDLLFTAYEVPQAQVAEAGP